MQVQLKQTSSKIGKTDFDGHGLHSFERIWAHYGKHIFRTIAGTRSGPVAFEISSPRMTFPTFRRGIMTVAILMSATVGFGHQVWSLQ